MKKLFLITALSLILLSACFHAQTVSTPTAEPSPAPAPAPEPSPPPPPPPPPAPAPTPTPPPATTKTPATSESSVRVINVEAGNFFFEPKNLTLKVNQPVEVRIKNSGVHTYTVPGLNVNSSFTGPSAVVKFTPTKTGTFNLLCATPGHAEAGMVGSITVE